MMQHTMTSKQSHSEDDGHSNVDQPRQRRRPTPPSWWTEGNQNTQQHMLAAQQLGARKR